MIYKIYGNSQDGWVQIGIVYQAKDARSFVDQIDSSLYDKVIIISHDVKTNTDDIYLMKCLDQQRVRKK